jgi:hypothetical protein
MFVDEADAAAGHLGSHRGASFDLTILASDLLYKSRVRAVLAARLNNDEFYSQGNYDYDAHAHVYRGGADPLGSRGYANAVKNPSSSLDAAREA